MSEIHASISNCGTLSADQVGALCAAGAAMKAAQVELHGVVTATAGVMIPLSLQYLQGALSELERSFGVTVTVQSVESGGVTS